MKIKYVLPGILLFIICCTEQKDEAITPEVKAVSIGAVKIITMPLSDQGSNWDPDSDADLFFTIESLKAVLYKYDIGKRKENLKDTDLPYRFVISPYELPLVDQAYTIRLYDYDDLSPDDLVGEVLFNPALYRFERPSQLTFASRNAKVEVDLSWR